MIRSFFTSILCILLLFACQTPADNSPPSDLQAVKAEMKTSLTQQLLHKWYPASLDTVHGGFLTDFSHDWQSTSPHNKFIVTQARHLWTASKAAAFFPDDPRYKQAADHAFAFLRDVMWDQEYGGFYSIVNREGELIMERGYRDEKRAYGNAFGIYGLAAYHKFSGNQEALALAKKGFLWLENHSHDPELGGYFQFLTRKGESFGRGYESVAGDQSQFGYKDQNSSIHLLEAFAELYQVWPDSLVEVRLREMLHLIRDTIVGEKPYLTLFLTPDWQPISYKDSSAAVRETHYHIDHVSFGHDVETAFLMLEADHVLGGQEHEKTLEVGKWMLDHSLNHGYDHELGGFYERGYYFANTDTMTIIHHGKNWWSQVEGFHSLLLFSTLYPEEKAYRESFFQLWNYCKEYLIDQEHGGWYLTGKDVEPEVVERPKGSIWKGNYHNARSLMNCIRLIEEM